MDDVSTLVVGNSEEEKSTLEEGHKDVDNTIGQDDESRETSSLLLQSSQPLRKKFKPLHPVKPKEESKPETSAASALDLTERVYGVVIRKRQSMNKKHKVKTYFLNHRIEINNDLRTGTMMGF
jgi:hypothetical protein